MVFAHKKKNPIGIEKKKTKTFYDESFNASQKSPTQVVVPSIQCHQRGLQKKKMFMAKDEQTASFHPLKVTLLCGSIMFLLLRTNFLYRSHFGPRNVIPSVWLMGKLVNGIWNICTRSDINQMPKHAAALLNANVQKIIMHENLL